MDGEYVKNFDNLDETIIYLDNIANMIKRNNGWGNLMTSTDSDSAYKDTPVPLQNMGNGWWLVTNRNGGPFYVNTDSPAHNTVLHMRSPTGTYLPVRTNNGFAKYCDA